MRRLRACLAAACLLAAPAAGEPAYQDSRRPLEQRVADLLGRMTLEEKAAQTHAIWNQAPIAGADGAFSPEKAAGVLNNGIGELVRVNESKGPRDGAVFANAVQKFLVEKTRLGVPAIVHEEALHGLVAPGAASFPQAIALASTWDTNLVERVFAAVAAETRARGGHQVLAPVLDVARDPRWGRTEETYGEDPYLVSRLGVAAIRGFQGRGPGLGPGRVIATAKHFAVHGQPEGGTNVAPGNYSERVVREVFLPSFKAAVAEAGVMSVMPSYNEIDGIPAHANRRLLEDVLRREWGFSGFIVSDYAGIMELETLHHVAADGAEAAAKALLAGVDIELPEIDRYAGLAAQVRQGLIPQAALDRAVANVLRAKFLLGLFENPYIDAEQAARQNNSAEHRALALEAAREALILLKNQGGLLPLDRAKLKSIAVIGPNAAVCHLGGYSGDPGRMVSVLDGVREKAGGAVRVAYAQGCKITAGQDKGARGWHDDKVELSDPAEDERLIAEAAAVAKGNDVALLVLGGNEQTSREGWSVEHLGDRDSLELVGRQNDLARAVLAAGKPTVVLLINGKPLSVNYLAENVPAILEGWYLGEETGHAVADVLFGDYNPAGRLPITFPRTVGQVPVYYNHKPSARRGYLFASREPLFAFGHGLSYTTFRYDNLRVVPERIGPDGKAVASVEVTNTGSRAGDEVVQLYIRDQVSSVTRPVKELKGFRRVGLKPGQTRKVEFEIGFEELAFYNEDMKRVVEPGAFDVMAGPSATELKTARLDLITSL